MDRSVTIEGAAYSIADAYAEGLRHHQSGLLAQAETVYRKILAIDPLHADSLHLLGMVAYQVGSKELAASLIGRAIGLKPDAPNYHNNLGNALRDLGRRDEALEHLRTAFRLRPESPEINSNLATALRDFGHSDEAIRHYRIALDHRPDAPELHYNLANILADIGGLSEAEICYRAALRLKPDFADAHYNLGNALVSLRRWGDAESSYRAALRAQPTHKAHNNLGIVLHELNRLDEAATCYRAALTLEPAYPEALYNIGCVFRAHSQLDAAAGCFERALALNPDYAAARFALCMAQLPVLYDSAGEIAERRSAYTMALDGLCAAVDRLPSLAALADGVGASQPFFLAYQGHNDVELQRRYGALICRIMAERYPPAALPAPRIAPAKIRIGIVSGFFCDHTVWHLLIKGWLGQVDRRRFEVLGYHTGRKSDRETDAAAALCDRFVPACASAAQWREAIRHDAPDVLLYPEIGMDPIAAQLAAQRLARVQCCAWGHPETTGFPTVDYFLSSALMEPADGDDHYSERLIRLPNLATYYEPDAGLPRAATRSEFGLRATSTAFWSGQALYKYLPQYDSVFPRIARAAPDSQFAFIEFAGRPLVTERFRQRLGRAFADFGLSADEHCVVLPPLDQDRFVAAIGQCDVVLDTIGWSGGRSTLDCLAQDPAIVTLAGPLMRGRHTAAILRRMEIDETIAADLDGYVAIAARLAQDLPFRSAIRGKVAANKSRVFRDHACIAALEDFLSTAVRGS